MNNNKPLALRCETATLDKKGFTIQENNEKHTVTPELAQKFLEARKLLSTEARIKLNALPVKNQLALVDALDCFNVEGESNGN